MASVHPVGTDRWRVRWRNRVGEPERDEKTIRGSRMDADEYKMMVERSIRDVGRFDKAAVSKVTPPANLYLGMLAYIDARAGKGRLGPSSAEKYQEWARTFVRWTYEALDLDAKSALPVTVLTRSTFDAVSKVAQAQVGPAYHKNIIGMVVQAWKWMGTDPASWPHVPSPPYDHTDYMPLGAIYTATEAPSMQHTDAVLRTLASREGSSKVDQATIVLALVLRYTGLRVGQVLAAQRSDLKVEERTLWVRKGKSKKEKAASRTVPVSRHLLAELALKEYLAGLPEDGPLITMTHQPTRTMRRAWKDSGVPERVWNPPQRKNARPQHAFRAALIAHLRDEGVAADVVDYLVGHSSGDTLKATHYGRALLADAREAVDALPPVDWTGPIEGADNVVPLHAAQEAR